jgi:hypothetical protein
MPLKVGTQQRHVEHGHPPNTKKEKKNEKEKKRVDILIHTIPDTIYV